MPVGDGPGSPSLEPSLAFAAAHHELGELASLRAAQARDIGSRHIGSHLGDLPDLAERVPLFRHPEANQVFDAMRANNPDDAYLQKKMREMGHTQAAPIPLGGRQHRALAKAVAERTPEVRAARMGRVINTNLRQYNKFVQSDPVKLITPLIGTPEFAPRAMAPGLRRDLALRAEQVGHTVDPLLKRVPAVQPLWDRFKTLAKEYTAPAHVKPGGAAEFLRHFSTVHR